VSGEGVVFRRIAFVDLPEPLLAVIVESFFVVGDRSTHFVYAAVRVGKRANETSAFALILVAIDFAFDEFIAQEGKFGSEGLEDEKHIPAAKVDIPLGNVFGGAEVGEAEVGEAEVGGAEVGEAEVGGAEVGGAEVGEAEVGEAEVGEAEVGEAEVGEAEVGGAEVGGAEVGEAEVGGAEVGEAEVGGAEVGGAEVGEAEVGFRLNCGL